MTASPSWAVLMGQLEAVECGRCGLVSYDVSGPRHFIGKDHVTLTQDKVVFCFENIGCYCPIL